MAIVKQYHKDTDTTYVYESTSYWDAEKGQSRSKRRVIGKIDPETGEIVPTGKRGRTKKEKPARAEGINFDISTRCHLCSITNGCNWNVLELITSLIYFSIRTWHLFSCYIFCFWN